MVDEQSHKAERQIELEQLFQRNYAALTDSALADRSLFVADAERIVEGLAKHVRDYTGPLTDQAFQEWAADAIRPAVARIAAFSKLKTENEKFVFDGIWSVLRNAADLTDDYTLHDIAADVWLWAFEELDDLLTPGTAKVSTRLHSKAYWQARRWKTERLRAREKFVSLSSDGQLEPSPDRDNVDAA